jgi:hypothetical protein
VRRDIGMRPWPASSRGSTPALCPGVWCAPAAGEAAVIKGSGVVLEAKAKAGSIFRFGVILSLSLPGLTGQAGQ